MEPPRAGRRRGHRRGSLVTFPTLLAFGFPRAVLRLFVVAVGAIAAAKLIFF